MNWLSGIGDFIGQAADAYSTVKGSTGGTTPGAAGSNTAAALSNPSSTAATAPGGINTNYLLIGGGVLVAGLAIFLALKK